MSEHRPALEHIQAYADHLRLEEKSAATVEKYLRDVRAFARWLEGREITKERTAAWKTHLGERGYAPASVNAMLSALNSLLDFLGFGDCRVKFLKVQRRMFRNDSRDLTRSDYNALTAAAKAQNKTRLALLMEAICATGIRVSEVQYITVEAARAGRAEVALKGKIRTILIPSKLCRKLLKYAKQQKTASGEIFLTRNGTPLSRRQIWAEMKGLCKTAGVAASKVFPHNLRHLFAAAFYRASRDIVKLADVLEHSPQHSNPNRLFQVLRKIPRTAQYTVNFHGSGALVNLIKYKILLNDHFAIYRVKRIDFTHLRVIAQFCDFIPHLFQHPAGGFGIKSRKIPGDIVQVLHGKGQIFDFIRHTVHGASPIHFRGLSTACWGQPPAVLPW